jgi:hypothetical protein
MVATEEALRGALARAWNDPTARITEYFNPACLHYPDLVGVRVVFGDGATLEVEIARPDRT